MVEKKSQENRDQTREEIIQQLFGLMFSLIKQMHKDVSFTEPLLSPPQARLVFMIAKSGDEGISVKELAQAADITPGAITQFTDVLIAKDMVRREEDPGDRRIIKLKINPSARSRMEKLHKDFLEAAARKFDVLSIDELKELVNLLNKVRREPFVKENPPHFH